MAGAPRAYKEPAAPRVRKDPDEERRERGAALIADLLCIHDEFGYINQTVYSLHGRFGRDAIVKHFGSWEAVCQIANVHSSGRPKPKEVTATTCVNCDVVFERPADDKTHRLCKTCRKNRASAEPIREEWAMVAGRG